MAESLHTNLSIGIGQPFEPELDNASVGKRQKVVIFIAVDLAGLRLFCFEVFYKIPPNLPFPKGGIIALFEKEGLGEIFTIISI